MVSIYINGGQHLTWAVVGQSFSKELINLLWKTEIYTKLYAIFVHTIAGKFKNKNLMET